MPDTSSGLEFEETVERMLNRIMLVLPRKQFTNAGSLNGRQVAVKKARYKSSMKNVPVGADPVTGKKRRATSTAEFVVYQPDGSRIRIEAKSMKSAGSVDEKALKLIADVRVPNKGYDVLAVITSGVTSRFIATLADAASRRTDIKLFQSVKDLRAYLTA